MSPHSNSTMFQNRVDPFGRIIFMTERGLWLGNRGVLHNDAQKIIRAFKTKAWITCALIFRDRRREIMQPDRWTELFFLDEATSFSAGHRPCFQCRYKDHQHFKKRWISGNPEYGFSAGTSIAEIDMILHSERISAGKDKIFWRAGLSALPDGAFVSRSGDPYLVKGAKLHRWTAGGYEEAVGFSVSEELDVLTPRSIVNTFIAGYIPQDSVK